MILRDRTEIEQRIKNITSGSNERVININENDIAPLLACKELTIVEAEAEDMANLAVTLLRDIREIGCKGSKNVILTVYCSRSYGLTMVDMEKLSCVMHSFEEDTELMWGVSYNNTMSMNKVAVSIVIGK